MKEEIRWQLDKEKQVQFRSRLLIFVVIIFVIGFIFGAGYIWLESQVNNPVSEDSEEYFEFTVADGSSAGAIASNLEEAGLIKSSFGFKYYVWSLGDDPVFRPGLFQLSPSMDIPEIVSVLTDDKSGEVQLTSLEGWTIEDIADEVSTEFARTSLGVELSPEKRESIKSDFLEAVNGKYDYDFLANLPEGRNLEGYLFPDTYRVFRSANMEDVIDKMLSNFSKKITSEMMTQIEQRGWTLDEVIILASVVQKEAKEADMREVAGIFISRLKSGQRLESDATVNYVTKKDALQPTYADVAIDSPYNTYQIAGLPIGPICNPGLSAIQAVIDPEITANRFFLNTPSGETLYSVTYEQHLEKKAKYLDGE